MNFGNFLDFIFDSSKVRESVFDTDVFREYQKKYGDQSQSFSDQEMEDINVMLTSPCALPFGEETMEGWFLRLSIWGKVKITHKNPEDKIKRTLTREQFINYVEDKQRNEAMGSWRIEEVELDKIRCYRKFFSINGKEEVEEIIIDIDMRDDLKRAIKKVRK